MHRNQETREERSFLEQEFAKCAKCGACRTVCPVFSEKKTEPYSARGKIALTEAVLGGELPLTRPYSEIVHNCLLCLSCVDNCSSGVRVDRIVTAARARLAREKGLHPAKRLAFRWMLLKRTLMDLFLEKGALLQSLLFRRIPESSGLRRRFPLPRIEQDRYVPALARRPFRTRFPEENRVAGASATVFFFTGCVCNYMMPEIGRAVVGVLNRLGVDVIVPRAQGCCGAPVDAAGDFDSVRELARNNIAALEADPTIRVVTCCASGGHMFKNVYPERFGQDPHFRVRAERLAARTLDISEYLVREIGPERIARQIRYPLGEKLTYHDPCHLNRGQKIFEEPRRLLELAGAGRFVEMDDAGRCCGSGGTYGIGHRDTSLGILRKKTDAVRATGARQVATGCPGCMIQLTDGLLRAGGGETVRHTIQVLAGAMGVETEARGLRGGSDAEGGKRR